MKVPRAGRPLVAPILRFKPRTDPPEGRLQPCPGCNLYALYRLPDEGCSTCGSCGLVADDSDYTDLYGPDPDVPRAPTPAHPPVVYYMRLDTLVKIGFTARLGRRLLDINPEGLLAVEWGARTREIERHNQFAARHVHGEWFRMCPEIAAHVVDARSTFDADMGSTEAWLTDVGAAWWWEPNLVLYPSPGVS